MSIYFRSRLFLSFFLMTAHFCFTVRLLVSLLSLSRIFSMLNSNSRSMWPITFFLFYIGIVLFRVSLFFPVRSHFPGITGINNHVFPGEETKFHALTCAIGREFAGVLRSVL